MSAQANSGTVQGKIVRDVQTPEEYKQAVKHAGALGLEITEIEGFGSWQTHDGHPVFIRAAGLRTVDVEKLGRKYFHIEIDGSTEKLQPSDGTRGKGKLRLTFEK